ncbi:MAG TPA: L-arabinose isomerase [Candidatus Limnocylindrales bacterium]|nr:L-arabinose isomerase [Candidatus Limnocylindrales bacterium]
MIDLSAYEVWFVTGSQHLYGPDALRTVEEHARGIAAALGESPHIPVRVVSRPLLTEPDGILRLADEANSAPQCIGLVTWMHTFSPAKMWIAGLQALRKPFLHLHTQYNREIPWAEIDMDFMNLNQAAHGDREFGFLTARLRLERKVVVGHWQDERVQREIGAWTRVASARQDWATGRIARFGDNMRGVAVTEGDKVEAQRRLGFSVNTWGVGDLARLVDDASDGDVDRLIEEYLGSYDVVPELRPGGDRAESLRDAARIELGLRRFLASGPFVAFTDTFEDLHGLRQLPGLAVQRLMADGYGFGGEGDWKTAAMVRATKLMSAGLEGGASFMEDYTYHLAGDDLVLGAHMLEVCPSIAAKRPRLEIHPLAIGGKADPVRLVFNARPGAAVATCITDMGSRFRIVAAAVDVIDPPEPLPRLPVARAVWRPRPDLRTSAAAWIHAGGSHHTSLAYAVTMDQLRDFAAMCGVEFLAIDADTRLDALRDQLRWSDLYWHLATGL